MPQTVHSVRERTVLGPTGLDQFFLSQNVQFSVYLLHVNYCGIIVVREGSLFVDFVGYPYLTNSGSLER